ncbi:MAG: GWxTD domain-containing protein [Candidatus Syntrophosphaera sp.]
MRNQVLKLTLLAILLVGSLQAQEVILERYPEGVDFWVMVPYNTLIFASGEDSADYLLTMEITSLTDKRLTNFEDAISVLKRGWLENTALPIQFQADLEPGRYQALLRLKNLALGDKYDLKKVFVIEEGYTQIGQPYLTVEKEGIRFIPAGLDDLPLPVGRCAIRQKFSAEVDSVMISFSVAAFKDTEPVREITADITDLINSGGEGGIVVSFFEGNIRYNMEPFYYSKWFAYNSQYSYEDQIRQLRYIANQNEWNSIRAATEEMHPDVIENFWKAHDPTPGTIRNEARESFYQRVMIADQRYTIHKRMKGWTSDRGRIYIKFGEPDEVYSEVHPLDMYPFIIWYYYRENLTFEFADTGGFGQYRLRNKDEEY